MSEGNSFGNCLKKCFRVYLYSTGVISFLTQDKFKKTFSVLLKSKIEYFIYFFSYKYVVRDFYSIVI